MASKLSRMTTDHDEIRRWAEERGAKPTEVARTERNGETGMIRLDFPGYSGAGSLKPISWDEWFEKFDQSGLALVYQDRTARGQKSNFNKLIGRETAEAREHGDNKASRRSPRGRGSASRRGAVARAGASGGRRGTASRKDTGARSSARSRGAEERSGRGGRRRGSAASRAGAKARQAPRTIAARLTGRARMSMTEGTTRTSGKRGASRRGRSAASASSSRKGVRRSTRSTRSGPRGGR